MRAVGVAALAFAVGLAGPAAAEQAYETAPPTRTPEVWYPVARNRPFGVAFQIEGPGAGRSYGIRAVARLVDEALPQVRIFRWGDHPGAHTIRAVVKRMPAGIGGLTHVGLDPIVVEMADDVPAAARRRVAAHELAHALGLYHHLGVGAVGSTNWDGSADRLSRSELEALAAWYRPR